MGRSFHFYIKKKKRRPPLFFSLVLIFSFAAVVLAGFLIQHEKISGEFKELRREEKIETTPANQINISKEQKKFSGVPTLAKGVQRFFRKTAKRVFAKKKNVRQETTNWVKPKNADLVSPVFYAPKIVSLDSLNLPVQVMGQIEDEFLNREIKSQSKAFAGSNGSSVSSSSFSADGLNKIETQGPGPFEYKIHAFFPGLTQSGKTIHEVYEDLTVFNPRVVGPPDYSLDTKEAMFENLLPLGNGGSIVLEIQGGYIVDGAGPDFVIFENPFVYKEGDKTLVYAETAVVSVSEQEHIEAYQMFNCNTLKPPYTGCAGVHPVRYSSGRNLSQVGGDLFDLADIGVPRAKYIRIEDTGGNLSFLEGTEGFDLDAVALLHTSYE